MIDTVGGLEHSELPLAFRVRGGDARSGPLAGLPGQTTIRVEARALGKHQKEALVTEGKTVWRLASDEPAFLQSTDLAPFPLAYFNAGLQADLFNQLRQVSAARGIALSALRSRLTTRYFFTGSFFKGTGQGIAESPVGEIGLQSDLDAEGEAALVAAAAHASPGAAALRQPLKNTFALYANGRRRKLARLPESSLIEVADPFKVHRESPRPDAGADVGHDLVAKLPVDAADAKRLTESPRAIPGEAARMEIAVHGEGSWTLPGHTSEFVSWAAPPTTRRFLIRSDEAPAGANAPSGLALLSAGIAFCFMTQLIRYIEHRKLDVRAIRLVQFNPFEIVLDSGERRGRAGAADTHLFLHGAASADQLEELLEMAARTCYLHAALGVALAPEWRLVDRG